MQRLIQRKPQLTAEEVAEQFIIKYFQEWDQTMVDRANALADLCRYCGMKVHVFNEENRVFIASNCADPPKEFMKELAKCWPKGNFEREVEAVKRVVEKYRRRSIWERIFK